MISSNAQVQLQIVLATFTEACCTLRFINYKGTLHRSRATPLHSIKSWVTEHKTELLPPYFETNTNYMTTVAKLKEGDV